MPVNDVDWFNYTIYYLPHIVTIAAAPSFLTRVNVTGIWVPENCYGPPSMSLVSSGPGVPASVTNESLSQGTYFFRVKNLDSEEDVEVSLSCRVDCQQCPPLQGCSIGCGQTFPELRTNVGNGNVIKYTIPSNRKVTIAVRPAFLGQFKLTAIWNPETCTSPNNSTSQPSPGVPASVTNESLPPGTYYFNVTHLVNDDTYDLSLTCSKVANGYSCSNGDDCQSGLCVQGICRASCSGYNKLNCSDDSTNNWNNDGICLDSTEGWQCVENVPNYCDFAIVNLTDTFVSSRSNTYHCLNQSFSLAGKNATQFSPGVQNSILDCLGYSLNGNDVSNTYGFYLTGSDTKNNTVKNCNIIDFWSGIYLYNSPNNNTLTNNMVYNNGYGIYLTSSSNNTITNNMANSNSNGGILLSSSSNNQITNNTASSTNWGISLWSSSNNTITNNMANSNTNYGIFISSSSNYNILTNNTANSNIQVGISLYSSSNYNILTNNTANSNNKGIYLYLSSSNSITGGSILENTYDYYLYSAGATNNFTNTNFTVARQIYFFDTTSWFNYNNRTDIGLWLKTNVSASQKMITRKLIKWTQSLMQWNDTPDAIITANYNITGLKPNTNYIVYNNSITAYPNLQTDSSGNLNFTIYLGSEHNITVQEIRRWLEVNLTEPSPIIYTPYNPKLVYKYNTFNVNANVTCHTDPPGSSGGCGSISSGVRYNSSGSTMTLVPNTTATPMYIVGGGIQYYDQWIDAFWNFSVANELKVLGPYGVAYNGTYFWVNNQTHVFRYNSTGGYTWWNISVAAQDNNMRGIDVNNTCIFMVGRQNSKIYLYNIETGSYITSYSISGQTTGSDSVVTNNTYIWVLSSASSDRYVYRYWQNGTYDNWKYTYDFSGSVTGDGLEFNGTHFFVSDISGTPTKRVWGYNASMNVVGPNITVVESAFGLAYYEGEKNFYTADYDNKLIKRYIQNSTTTGSYNPTLLSILNDGDSKQINFIVNATSKGDYKIDVNFTSDFQGVENNTDDSYIRVKDLTDEYLIVNSIEIKPSSSFNPISSGNVTTNVTVNITNSTYMHPTDNCTVRIFNTSDSYSSPTIGPLPGRIQKSDSQWQCFCGWNMEYWQNPGPWNVSVKLTLWNGLNNFTSKNFTYGSLYAWNDNITTGCINWTGLPGQTVNSSNAYPMLINNTGNTKLNISINGSDFINGPYVIGVGNASFSNYTINTFYNLSKTPQFMINLSVLEVKYIYFRAYIPIGFISQQYNNSILMNQSY
jgi:parallel beta-helix repeat protein